MQPTIIGLDIAKHAFQMHGIDAADRVVARQKLRRSQVVAFFRVQRQFWRRAHCLSRNALRH